MPAMPSKPNPNNHTAGGIALVMLVAFCNKGFLIAAIATGLTEFGASSPLKLILLTSGLADCCTKVFIRTASARLAGTPKVRKMAGPLCSFAMGDGVGSIFKAFTGAEFFKNAWMLSPLISRTALMDLEAAVDHAPDQCQ